MRRVCTASFNAPNENGEPLSILTPIYLNDDGTLHPPGLNNLDILRDAISVVNAEQVDPRYAQELRVQRIKQVLDEYKIKWIN